MQQIGSNIKENFGKVFALESLDELILVGHGLLRIRFNYFL